MFNNGEENCDPSQMQHQQSATQQLAEKYGEKGKKGSNSQNSGGLQPLTSMDSNEQQYYDQIKQEADIIRRGESSKSLKAQEKQETPTSARSPGSNIFGVFTKTYAQRGPQGGRGMGLEGLIKEFPPVNNSNDNNNHSSINSNPRTQTREGVSLPNFPNGINKELWYDRYQARSMQLRQGQGLFRGTSNKNQRRIIPKSQEIKQQLFRINEVSHSEACDDMAMSEERNEKQRKDKTSTKNSRSYQEKNSRQYSEVHSRSYQEKNSKSFQELSSGSLKEKNSRSNNDDSSQIINFDHSRRRNTNTSDKENHLESFFYENKLNGKQISKSNKDRVDESNKTLEDSMNNRGPYPRSSNYINQSLSNPDVGLSNHTYSEQNTDMQSNTEAMTHKHESQENATMDSYNSLNKELLKNDGIQQRNNDDENIDPSESRGPLNRYCSSLTSISQGSIRDEVGDLASKAVNKKIDSQEMREIHSLNSRQQFSVKYSNQMNRSNATANYSFQNVPKYKSEEKKSLKNLGKLPSPRSTGQIKSQSVAQQQLKGSRKYQGGIKGIQDRNYVAALPANFVVGGLPSWDNVPLKNKEQKFMVERLNKSYVFNQNNNNSNGPLKQGEVSPNSFQQENSSARNQLRDFLKATVQQQKDMENSQNSEVEKLNINSIKNQLFGDNPRQILDTQQPTTQFQDTCDGSHLTNLIQQYQKEVQYAQNVTSTDRDIMQLKEQISGIDEKVRKKRSEQNRRKQIDWQTNIDYELSNKTNSNRYQPQICTVQHTNNSLRSTYSNNNNNNQYLQSSQNTKSTAQAESDLEKVDRVDVRDIPSQSTENLVSRFSQILTIESQDETFENSLRVIKEALSLKLNKNMSQKKKRQSQEKIRSFLKRLEDEATKQDDVAKSTPQQTHRTTNSQLLTQAFRQLLLDEPLLKGQDSQLPPRGQSKTTATNSQLPLELFFNQGLYDPTTQSVNNTYNDSYTTQQPDTYKCNVDNDEEDQYKRYHKQGDNGAQYSRVFTNRKGMPPPIPVYTQIPSRTVASNTSSDQKRENVLQMLKEIKNERLLRKGLHYDETQSLGTTSLVSDQNTLNTLTQTRASQKIRQPINTQKMFHTSQYSITSSQEMARATAAIESGVQREAACNTLQPQITDPNLKSILNSNGDVLNDKEGELKNQVNFVSLKSGHVYSNNKVARAPKTPTSDLRTPSLSSPVIQDVISRYGNETYTINEPHDSELRSMTSASTGSAGGTSIRQEQLNSEEMMSNQFGDLHSSEHKSKMGLDTPVPQDLQSTSFSINSQVKSQSSAESDGPPLAHPAAFDEQETVGTQIGVEVMKMTGDSKRGKKGVGGPPSPQYSPSHILATQSFSSTQRPPKSPNYYSMSTGENSFNNSLQFVVPPFSESTQKPPSSWGPNDMMFQKVGALFSQVKEEELESGDKTSRQDRTQEKSREIVRGDSLDNDQDFQSTIETFELENQDVDEDDVKESNAAKSLSTMERSYNDRKSARSEQINYNRKQYDLSSLSARKIESYNDHLVGNRDPLLLKTSTSQHVPNKKGLSELPSQSKRIRYVHTDNRKGHQKIFNR